MTPRVMVDGRYPAVGFVPMMPAVNADAAVWSSRFTWPDLWDVDIAFR
ncbi:hypothetical protein [Mycobacterium sp. 29Ha]|nr:hypothetical protein [Mycobacterium sp. 29Ha]MDV3133418.1 hypothetical protein [Mycobacterium sp. 29Ha]